MRIFQTKWFARWAATEALSARAQTAAIAEIEQGLVDAYLGGGLIKKRVATGGRGKRAGLRTIIALKAGESAYFLYGFAKNQQGNVGPKELRVLRRMATYLLALDAQGLDAVTLSGELVEVANEEA